VRHPGGLKPGSGVVCAKDLNFVLPFWTSKGKTDPKVQAGPGQIDLRRIGCRSRVNTACAGVLPQIDVYNSGFGVSGRARVRPPYSDHYGQCRSYRPDTGEDVAASDDLPFWLIAKGNKLPKTR
jgi:hypothetical protein